jgi:hypothetical protein
MPPIQLPLPAAVHHRNQQLLPAEMTLIEESTKYRYGEV